MKIGDIVKVLTSTHGAPIRCNGSEGEVISLTDEEGSLPIGLKFESESMIWYYTHDEVEFVGSRVLRTGDSVKVISPGETFSGYASLANRMGAVGWRSGWAPRQDEIGTVRSVTHDEGTYIALVAFVEREALIGVSGLEYRRNSIKFSAGDEVKILTSDHNAPVDGIGKVYMIDLSNGRTPVGVKINSVMTWWYEERELCFLRDMPFSKEPPSETERMKAWA